jgi:hypothetical protein
MFHISRTTLFFSNTKPLDNAQKPGNPNDLFQHFISKAILNLKLKMLTQGQHSQLESCDIGTCHNSASQYSLFTLSTLETICATFFNNLKSTS